MRTPLMEAAFANHPDTLRILLDARADPRLENRQLETALSQAHEVGSKACMALLREAASRQWSTVTTPPRGFDDLARYLPAGCNGVARADLAGIADMPIDWWLEAVPDLLPRDLRPQVDEDLAEDQREAVRAMLIANRLAVLRTATGTSDGTWRWRLFW